jgi:hypothetical protein
MSSLSNFINIHFDYIILIFYEESNKLSIDILNFL